jgi:hypothetical protein
MHENKIPSLASSECLSLIVTLHCSFPLKRFFLDHVLVSGPEFEAYARIKSLAKSHTPVAFVRMLADHDTAKNS